MQNVTGPIANSNGGLAMIGINFRGNIRLRVQTFNNVGNELLAIKVL